MTVATKLALGSVQFGLDYGISNQSGKVTSSEVSKLLSLASQLNIKVIDTASSYGDSEKVLGQNTERNQFSYLGKISPRCSPSGYSEEATASLTNLNANQFECLSLHHGDVLSSHDGKAHYHALERLKLDGLTKYIGCSLYSVEEALTLTEQFNFDIVQIPASICDQRLFEGDALQILSERKVAVHIRSVFLQGLILMSPDQLPEKLKDAKPLLLKLQEQAKQENVSIASIALSPFVNHPLIEQIIVGCVNRQQLTEILDSYEMAKTLDIDTAQFAIQDLDIIDPRNWS